MPFFLMLRRLSWLLLALFALAACAPAATTNPTSAALATATPAQTSAPPSADPTPTAEVVAAAAGLPSNRPAFLDSFASW